MKRSVIYSHGGGRLGNQLLNHAHLLAFEKEHEDVMRVTNVSFYKYFELYDNHNIVYYGGTGNSIIDLLVKQARLARVYDGPCGKYAEYLATFLLHGIASIGLESQSVIARGHYNGIPGKRVRRINFDDLSDVKKVFSRNITVLAGWECRGWNILQDNKEYVVSKMSISHKYLAIAEDFINKIRDRFDLVVGVFIRRGDYRVWEGGKYFIDPSVYKDICRAIRDRNVGKKVAFVVASDEAQDGFFTEKEFIPATGIRGGDGHFMESFAELSLCDYIISPPSTFSGFAAFLGNVPIIPLYPGCKPSLRGEIVHDLFEAKNHEHFSAAVQ